MRESGPGLRCNCESPGLFARSPSPQPSPAGRGRNVRRFLAISEDFLGSIIFLRTQGKLDARDDRPNFTDASERVSLSLGERAGVRAGVSRDPGFIDHCGDPNRDRNPVGVEVEDAACSQGSSFLATLGWRPQPRWGCLARREPPKQANCARTFSPLRFLVLLSYLLLPAAYLSARAASVEENAKTHWSFRPLTRPPIPEYRAIPSTSRPHPIDCFIIMKLLDNGVVPKNRYLTPTASRTTLIRRLKFSLLGLPPTPEEVAAFVADPNPDFAAYCDLVDRFLASYGVPEDQP